ncbi:6-carboxytetrahydropterin synthase QueD [bacterium]|nr:6-carboxytetrahydropterin synthase QueD [bacterium]
MYKIKVYDYISGAHFLRNYHGKCENLHGHNWKIEIEFSSNDLDKLGMVMDFKLAKNYLKEIINVLDHKNLNEIEPFDKINPTAENLAKFIFDRINKKAEDKNNYLKSVSVWETETNCAVYERDK